MPHLTISGQTLYYHDQGQGTALLLGHSYLWDSRMWQPQIQVLSRHYRVIAPDLWGHGASENLPEGTQSLADLAQQMAELMEALGISQYHVLGLSVGGMWGAELALRYPQRVLSLVMMDTYLGAEPEVTRQRYFQLLDTIEASGEIAAPLREIIVPIFFHPDTEPTSSLYCGFDQRLMEFTSQRLRNSVVPLGRLIFGRPDALLRLRGLNPQTTLLLVGDKDIPRPAKEMWQMAEIIGTIPRLIPNAGHISNLESPLFVTEELLSWLATH
jgi:pimeloyl-ACP methyl ester carboxylesterase